MFGNTVVRDSPEVIRNLTEGIQSRYFADQLIQSVRGENFLETIKLDQT